MMTTGSSVVKLKCSSLLDKIRFLIKDLFLSLVRSYCADLDARAVAFVMCNLPPPVASYI